MLAASRSAFTAWNARALLTLRATTSRLVCPNNSDVVCRALQRRGSFASSSFPSMANTTPADVLAFWFGPEALEVRSVMSTDEFMNAGKKMWYFGGKEVDVQSQRFVPAIEAAAEGTLPWDDDDDDANLAKVILFDQLTRNAFRGTPKAFAYDEKALDIARRLIRREAYWEVAELNFIASPHLHSERLSDHDAALAAVVRHKEKHAEALHSLVYLEGAIVSHRDVIAEFGRYPHRNKALGRASTPEEESWLASDDRPGWSKTQ